MPSRLRSTARTPRTIPVTSPRPIGHLDARSGTSAESPGPPIDPVRCVIVSPDRLWSFSIPDASTKKLASFQRFRLNPQERARTEADHGQRAVGGPDVDRGARDTEATSHIREGEQDGPFRRRVRTHEARFSTAKRARGRGDRELSRHEIVQRGSRDEPAAADAHARELSGAEPVANRADGGS